MFSYFGWFGCVQEVVSALTALWSQEHRECHYSALELAGRTRALWTPNILDTFELVLFVLFVFLNFFFGFVLCDHVLCCQLIRNKSWWDTVDTLSGDMVGHCVRTWPDHVFPAP